LSYIPKHTTLHIVLGLFKNQPSKAGSMKDKLTLDQTETSIIKTAKKKAVF